MLILLYILGLNIYNIVQRISQKKMKIKSSKSTFTRFHNNIQYPPLPWVM